MCGLFLRPSPRLLCTATKQKNNGQNLEEDLGHCEPKTDPSSADKTLLEEKVKLEEQLKETMVRTLSWMVACMIHTAASKFTGNRAEPFNCLLPAADPGSKLNCQIGTRVQTLLAPLLTWEFLCWLYNSDTMVFSI